MSSPQALDWSRSTADWADEGVGERGEPLYWHWHRFLGARTQTVRSTTKLSVSVQSPSRSLPSSTYAGKGGSRASTLPSLYVA